MPVGLPFSTATGCPTTVGKQTLQPSLSSLPQMARKHPMERTACTQLLCSARLFPSCRAARSVVAYSRASSRMVSAGTLVTGSAHSGLYCSMQARYSSKPWHQVSTNPWS